MYSIEKLTVGSYRANCYLLESDGHLLIIDPGDEFERIREAVGDRPVSGIVLTHCHCDHIGAVNELVEMTGAPVMIGKDDEIGVQDTHLSGFDDEGSDYVVEEVDRPMVAGEIIVWGDSSLVVLHTPGHTPGSICLYDASAKNMFTGDTLFAEAIGRTDYVRGDADDMRASLLQLGNYPSDVTIYPGHGQQSDLGTEKARNPWLGVQR